MNSFTRKTIDEKILYIIGILESKKHLMRKNEEIIKTNTFALTILKKDVKELESELKDLREDYDRKSFSSEVGRMSRDICPRCKKEVNSRIHFNYNGEISIRCEICRTKVPGKLNLESDTKKVKSGEINE